MPLWMTRQQAKKLMTATKGFADFPVMLETWRTCLKDEFDLVAAYEALERLAAGEQNWSMATVSVPSPFAAGIAFGQVSRYMYADDAPEGDGRSALSDDLIRQAVFDQALRPAIGPEVIRDFESRAQRTRPGYVPDDEDELVEWVKERVAIIETEWFEGIDIPSGVRRVKVGGRSFIVHPEIDLGADPVRQAGEMLQFYGPRTPDELRALLPFGDVAAILRELTDGEDLVRGTLVDGSDAEYLCDADNLETLIRFQRAAARPGFEPRPLTDLTPFLADWQGFGGENDEERLLDLSDRLRGYAAPVDFWLDEAFASRLPGATTSSLDAAATNGGLAWRGAGTEVVRIGFDGDFDLLDADPASSPEHALATFKDPHARYTFLQLFDESGLDADAFNAVFWDAVWSGRMAADGFAVLDAARSRDYALYGARPGGSREPIRRSRSRARGVSMGWPGTWYRCEAPGPVADGIEKLEQSKERCRLLLDRYGILTREHANREGGPFRWSAVFPALRLMELSGEVVAGLFFEEMSGPQFALPEAARRLERLGKSRATFWISAHDPVAPCGLGLALPDLPHRRAGNHLGYFEGTLALVSENFARRLTIRLEPDHPGLDSLLPNLAVLCRRRKRLTPESINDEPARGSPYLAALSRHVAVVKDHKGVYFETREL